jgi:hypothetical protein
LLSLLAVLGDRQFAMRFIDPITGLFRGEHYAGHPVYYKTFWVQMSGFLDHFLKSPASVLIGNNYHPSAGSQLVKDLASDRALFADWQGTEFHIINYIFQTGLFGLSLLCAQIYLFMKAASKLEKHTSDRFMKSLFSGFSLIILALFLSLIHYNTFMNPVIYICYMSILGIISAWYEKTIKTPLPLSKGSHI